MCQSKPDKVLKLSFDADIYNASRVQVESTTSATPSPSSSPTASDRPSNPSTTSIFFSDSGINKGAIAGIVFGVLAGIAFILIGTLFFLGRLKRKNRGLAIDGGSEAGNTQPGTQAYSSALQQKGS
jgi:hypothetical protein